MDILKEARRVFDVEINELNRVKNNLDGSFIELVNLILNKKGKLIITGVGKSGIIGKKITATLASTGTTTIFIHSTEALHGDLGMVNPEDIVIAISNSGNSVEVLDTLLPLKYIGAKIVALTGNVNSKLAKESDLVINIGVKDEASDIEMAPMTSTTATLVFGDALASVLIKLNNFTEKDFGKYHPGGILGKRLLLRIKDIMHKDEELPIVFKDADMNEMLMVLTEKKLGVVCIIEKSQNEENQLLGIITEGDIRRALVHKEKFFEFTAEDLMIKEPVTISSDILAIEALNKMENRKNQLNVLPVVDNEKLVGMIRIHDLLELK